MYGRMCNAISLWYERWYPDAKQRRIAVAMAMAAFPLMNLLTVSILFGFTGVTRARDLLLIPQVYLAAFTLLFVLAFLYRNSVDNQRNTISRSGALVYMILSVASLLL